MLPSTNHLMLATGEQGDDTHVKAAWCSFASVCKDSCETATVISETFKNK